MRLSARKAGPWEPMAALPHSGVAATQKKGVFTEQPISPRLSLKRRLGHVEEDSTKEGHGGQSSQPKQRYTASQLCSEASTMGIFGQLWEIYCSVSSPSSQASHQFMSSFPSAADLSLSPSCPSGS